jgi:transposase
VELKERRTGTITKTTPDDVVPRLQKLLEPVLS